MGQTRAKNIIGWVLRILLGVFFVVASAVPKLTGDPEVAANFDRWGYPGWFLLVIGIAEMLGGIGLLISLTAGWAASGLAVVMLGAVWTHLAASDGAMVLVPVIVLVLLAVVVYLRWPLRPDR